MVGADRARFSLGLLCLTAFLSVLWLALWATVVPALAGWSPVVISSGSMQPKIGVGDIVLAVPPENDEALAPETVIVFENPAGPGYVTHRVVARDPAGNYVTRGDANTRVDSTPVPPESIVGVAEILVPVVGLPAVWFEHGQWLRLVAVAIGLAAVVRASRWVLQTGSAPKTAPIVLRATADLVGRARIDRVGPMAASVVSVVVVTALIAGTATSVATFTSSASSPGNSFVVDVWKSVVGVDGGAKHACLARTEGYVWCWGRNDKGQLGDDSTDDSLIPVDVVGSGGTGLLSDVVDIASGGSSNCAVLDDGSVKCWGLNGNGQLGDDTTDDSSVPVSVSGPGGSGSLSGAVDVAVGLNHACAAKTDGTVWCWGRNDRGQLGDDSTSDSEYPVQVVGSGGSGTLSGVATVVAGTSFTCAVKTDGTVWCWGLNNEGQLGDDSTDDSEHPVQVVGSGGSGTFSGADRASAGEKHACAVKTDGTVWCWGRNDKGQLGDDSTADSEYPVQVVGAGGTGTLTGIDDIASGLAHSCGVKADGTTWCWGRNDKGQLGDDSTDDSEFPVQVVGEDGTGTLAGAVLAGAGDSFSCVAMDDWTARCWGLNSEGQLADNTTTDSSTPVQVKGAGWLGVFADAVSIAAGLTHTCAARTNGTVWCWGVNDKGQLGDDTTDDSLSPTVVSGPGGTGTLSGVVSVAAGDKSTCARKSDGTVWCWGLNDKGQLGDDSTTDSSVPVQVTGSGGSGTLTNVDALAVGKSHACASKSDGTAWCWGRNDKGQLGDDSTDDSEYPVQVVGDGGSGTLANTVAVTAGESHSCAITSDTTVWCWGLNERGQLGDDSTADSEYPVHVVGVGGTGTLSGVTSIAAGQVFTCAVTSGGSAYCWGRNDKGQLGDDSTDDSESPVQVTGAGGSGNLTQASSVAAGLAHSCVVKTDDTMWCWGLNDNGQLGDDSTSNSSSPVQVTDEGGVGTIGDAVAGAGGATYSCVIRTGGAVWCWGRNDKGQLGDGTTDDTTSPVQVI